MRYEAVPDLLQAYLTEDLSGRPRYMNPSKAAITLHGRPA